MNEGVLSWLTSTLKKTGQVNTLSPTGDLVDAKGSLSVSAKSHQLHTAPFVTPGCASEASYYSKQSLAILMWVIISGFFLIRCRGIQKHSTWGWVSQCMPCHGYEKSSSLHTFYLWTGTFPPGDRKPGKFCSQMNWFGLACIQNYQPFCLKK